MGVLFYAVFVVTMLLQILTQKRGYAILALERGLCKMDNIVSSAKTDMFRLRINPDIRNRLEDIYAKNGLTLTDAVNVFFQQSLNAGGFPFSVTEDNAQLIKAKALSRLMKELQKGDESQELYDEAQTAAVLGIEA